MRRKVFSLVILLVHMAQHFRRTYHLRLQRQIISQARKEQKELPLASAGFLLGLFFGLQDGGDIFL
jgi:hypothetical protein